MSKATGSNANRIQLRALPDYIVKLLNDPLLGTKLQQTLNKKIDISGPLTVMLNNASKNARIEILLTLLLADLAAKENSHETQLAASEPPTTVTPDVKLETHEANVEESSTGPARMTDEDFDSLK